MSEEQVIELTEAMSAVVDVPVEMDEPKQEAKPYYQDPPENIAARKGKKAQETVNKFRKRSASWLRKFKNRNARKDFDEKLDEWDAMWRASLTATYRRNDQLNTNEDGDTEKKTRSNVASTAFHQRVAVRTSNRSMIMFQEGKMPFREEPLPGTDEYTENEGQRVADYHNLLNELTWSMDGVPAKLKDALLFCGKNSLQVMAIEWDRRKRMIPDRVATDYDENGIPTAYDFKDKEEIIADHPTLRLVDIKDFYFDNLVDDEERWVCTIEKFNAIMPELMEQARIKNGYTNLDKLKTKHLYVNEGDNETLRHRAENADEESDEDATGAFKMKRVFLRAPINDDGVWDEKKTPATEWWEGIFGGELGETDAVCVMLRKRRDLAGISMYKLMHEMRDDKGALHMGSAELIASLYWEHYTTKNQLYDMRDRLVNVPYLAEAGSILSQGRQMEGNITTYIKPGREVKPAPILDATSPILQSLSDIGREMDDALHTTPPVMGMARARVSATGEKQALEQGLKPITEDTRYMADQVFPWMASMYRRLWRFYGDPKRIVTVTRQGENVEIRPAELYGPLRTRVTCVDHFESDVTRRAEQDKFLQVIFPFMAKDIGRKQRLMIYRQLLEDRKIVDNIPAVLPFDGDYDAEHHADEENAMMLYQGTMEYPSQGEDNDVHLSRHHAAEALYGQMPKEDQNNEKLSMLKLHIQLTEQMKEQAMAATPAQSALQPETAAQTPGEESGDQLAAGYGDLGQAGPA